MSLIQSREKDGIVNVCVSGYVTKDPKIPESKKLVFFSVCYGKGKFMDCKAWLSGKVGQLAACLERHDEVCVYGIYDPFEDKDGKKHDQIRVDHISIQQEAPQAPAENGSATPNAKAPEQTQFEELDELDEGQLPF